MITLTVDDGIVPAHARLGARYAAIADAVRRMVPHAPEGDISVSYVEDDGIRRLNRMYRGKDAVTDVLSFASGFPEQSRSLGDVLICYDQAFRQAAAFADGASVPDVTLECMDLVVHGILHILGYDHERPEDAAQMFPLQDHIVAACI